jgi:hypothetical protein
MNHGGILDAELVTRAVPAGHSKGVRQRGIHDETHHGRIRTGVDQLASAQSGRFDDLLAAARSESDGCL